MTRLEFQAASDSRQPVTIAFSDGREYEFPGDVEADAWLSFLSKYADFLEGTVIPARVVEPMYRTVIGDDMFDRLRKELTWSELTQVATALWGHYAGTRSLDDDEGENTNPS